MIQFYNEMKVRVNEISALFTNSPGQIQKIYSTGRFICLQVRIPGKTLTIYLGRGGGFEGIWLSDELPPSELRIRDVYLEYLRAHLTSSLLCSIEMDDKDRIISLNLRKMGKLENLLLFYKGRELYVAFQHYKDDLKKIFTAWNGRTVNAQTNLQFEIMDELGRTDLNKDSASNLPVKDIDVLLEEEMKQSSKVIKNKKKYTLIGKIQKDIEKLEGWKELKAFIDNQSEEEISSLPKKWSYKGLKINFSTKAYYKRRSEIFERIKSLKTSQKTLLERIKTVEAEPDQFKLESSIVHPVWMSKPAKAEPSKNESSHIVTYKDETLLLVIGKNAEGNDYLRNSFSRSDDWWFHLDNLPSSHVLLRPKENILSQEMIQLASSALAEFSQCQIEMIPVMYTQYKNLKAIKGKQGAVNFKKEKHLLVRFDPDWKLRFVAEK